MLRVGLSLPLPLCSRLTSEAGPRSVALPLIATGGVDPCPWTAGA